jgi:hypothetical protein
MNKKEIKQLNSIKSSHTCSHILKELSPKNISDQKESNISNKKTNNSKNKSESSNQLNSVGEEIKSKSSVNVNAKAMKKEKEKERNNRNKKKKRDGDKIIKLLKKNEKLKIPTGKRRSIAVNCIKLNLNNINNITKSLTPPKASLNIRTDKNGIEINKSNKKRFHITFLDDISPDNKITDTVNIQSFKKFNLVEKNQFDNTISNYSKCCNIF